MRKEVVVVIEWKDGGPIEVVPGQDGGPKEPGFYIYSGGRQNMIFLRREYGFWYALFDNGDYAPCGWEYIEQALGVYELLRVDAVVDFYTGR